MQDIQLEDRIEPDLSDFVASFFHDLWTRLSLHDLNELTLAQPGRALEIVKNLQLEIERSRHMARAILTASQQMNGEPTSDFSLDSTEVACGLPS